MSQRHDIVLKPVAYMSKKMIPSECRYEIHDKELLTVIKAFEEWAPELIGSPRPITVMSDHKALKYFTTKQRLDWRQIRWSETMSAFSCKLTYRPSSKAVKLDALSRRSAHFLQDANDERELDPATKF